MIDVDVVSERGASHGGFYCLCATEIDSSEYSDSYRMIRHIQACGLSRLCRLGELCGDADLNAQFACSVCILQAWVIQAKAFHLLVERGPIDAEFFRGCGTVPVMITQSLQNDLAFWGFHRAS